MNPWLILTAAILVEVAGTLCLKVAADASGMARVLPGIGVALFYVSTFVLMAMAMKRLDMGTTYAVWAGAGTALVALASVPLFGESYPWPKLAGIALIVAGVMLVESSDRHKAAANPETNAPAAPPTTPAA
jgi:small multidrug resistance pump